MPNKKISQSLEESLSQKYNLIAGLDEAGRGALAGPIVVVAVILPAHFRSSLIQDSKILQPQQRKRAYHMIQKNALEYTLVIKSSQEVEKKNPLVATKEAMIEAILQLKNKPNLCLVDGREEISLPDFTTQSIIGGDHKSTNIAAASIVAKVTRDAMMEKFHQKYPQYDWKSNKGYFNPNHLQAIFRYGICPLHRKTYEPIKSLISGKASIKTLKEKYKL